MDAWYSAHHAAHHGHGELIGGRLVGGFELPVRADSVRSAFIDSGLGAVQAPAAAGLAPILAVHDARVVDFLQGAWARWSALGHSHPALGMVWNAGLGTPQTEPRHIEGAFGGWLLDAGCTIVAGTWEAADWSAPCAIGAAQALLAGAPAAFAICRPPGHSDTARAMGGDCDLNNAAIAVQLPRDGGVPRVGVVDIDDHHGNGTQTIFWQRGDVFVTSLRADPHDDDPCLSGHAGEVGEGVGAGFNLNLPLPAGTTAPAYLAALEAAIDATLARGCGAVVVSLGVDTFERDPISKFKLASGDDIAIGARLRRLGMPVLFVFDGGDGTGEVGLNAVNGLAGFSDG